MARDSSGSKNQPHYANPGVPADAADMSEIADYAATIGNTRADTNAVRLGLTGSDLWDGLAFAETDTTITYLRVAGTWVPWLSPWITYTPTVTGITLGTGGTLVARHRYMHGKVEVSYIVTLGSAGFAVGTLPTITFPVTAIAPAITNQGLAGRVTFWQSGAANPTISGDHSYSGTSTTAFRLLAYPNTVGVPQPVTAAAPWTWAAGNMMAGEFTYQIS